MCHQECELCLRPIPSQPSTSRYNTETNTRHHANHTLTGRICETKHDTPLLKLLNNTWGHFVLQLYHKTAWGTSSLKTSSLLVPKCIKLPTFFVYDRLNIPDLIHFSGTDFTPSFLIQVAPAVLTLCYIVQTVSTDTPHTLATDSTVALYGSSGIRWL